MDDRLKREFSSRRFDSATEWNRPFATEFTKRGQSSTAFYCTRNTLRHEQPPWKNIAIPSVDDDFNILVKQVSYA